MTDKQIYDLLDGYVELKDDSYLKRTGKTLSHSTFVKIENKIVYITYTHDEVYANKSIINSINHTRKITRIVENNPNPKSKKVGITK